MQAVSIGWCSAAMFFTQTGRLEKELSSLQVRVRGFYYFIRDREKRHDEMQMLIRLYGITTQWKDVKQH